MINYTGRILPNLQCGTIFNQIKVEMKSLMMWENIEREGMYVFFAQIYVIDSISLLQLCGDYAVSSCSIASMQHNHLNGG